jgi:hypothetical protein
MEDSRIMNHPTGANFMSNDIELLQCPFCGGSAKVFSRTCETHSRYDPMDRAFPMARCDSCFASANGEDWKGEETAIKAWNTRAALAAPQQVPVGYGVFWIEKGMQCSKLSVIESDVLEFAARNLSGLKAAIEPIYRAAPVPPTGPALSDEEITMHWDVCVSRKDPAQSFEGLVIDFARALLAKVTRP